MTDTVFSAPTADSSARRRLLLGLAAALSTVVIWALWMVGTRHAVTTTLDPAAVGVLRFSGAAILLAPVWLRAGLKPKGVPLPVLLGLFGSGAPFFLIVATGMRFAPAADVGPLLPGSMPLFVALLGWLALRERFDRWRILGFALIVGGVLAIGGRGLLASADGAWRGHILFLAGAVMWAVYTLCYRRSGLSPMQAAAIIGAWSFLIVLPFGLPGLIDAARHGALVAIAGQAVLQGILSGIVAIVLYGYAIDRLGAANAAVVSPLGPVLAALIAIPLLGEWPDAAAIAGIVLATIGVLLASGVRLPRRS
jgi:drug/metabolite transporter (DMT)-like permease